MIKAETLETGYNSVQAAKMAAGPDYGLYSKALMNHIHMMPFDSEFLWVEVNDDEELLMYKRTPEADELVNMMAKAATFDSIARSTSVMRKSPGQGLAGSGTFKFTLSNQLIWHYYNTYIGN